MSLQKREILLVGPVNLGTPAGLGVLMAKFVCHSDCQQLVFLLPEDGNAGYLAFCFPALTPEATHHLRRRRRQFPFKP